MSNWITYKLGEIAEIIGGGTPSTTVDENWNGSIPWLTPRDLTNYNYRYIGKGERGITESGLKNSSTRLLPEGTVLLTSRAPIGYLAIANNPLCTNQGFKSFITDNRKVNNHFLYYLLKNNVEYIKSLGTGTTFAEVSGGALKSIEFEFPEDISEQSRIASILSSIDDKIELNLQVSRTIETMAQAIFKEWFVDFRFPGFDGVLVNGLPKRWSNGKLGNFCKIYRGASPRPITDPKYFSNGTIPWIKIADATSEGSIYITRTKEYCTELAISKSRFIRRGTLIMSNSATVGLPMILDINGCVHDGWLIFEDFQLITRNFLFFILTNNMKRFISVADGSVQKNLNTGILKNLEILIPDEELISKFDNLSQSIFDKLLSIEKENQIFIQLRDNLLPRLMTGKIRVA